MVGGNGASCESPYFGSSFTYNNRNTVVSRGTEVLHHHVSGPFAKFRDETAVCAPRKSGVMRGDDLRFLYIERRPTYVLRSGKYCK